ncbi:hypothetical protein [Brevibacillus sp. SYSU BS000544]|uniref:hypothetical protein n=1 Tax=Brevibacillus sp. SYSU BS000544 TaxID=3416443 RepID=UPI003CE552AD
MELKKPNQISIKLNGSAVQPKKETSKPREGRKPFIPSPAMHLPEEASGEIRELQPQVLDESLKSAENFAEESTAEEDALFRLNQLRYQSTFNRTSQEDPDESNFHGPILDLDGDDEHADSTWLERLRTNRLNVQKGIKRSMPPFTRTPWFRVMASTVGAVALGLVFGFTVLMVFKEEQLSQSYKTVLGETLQIPGKQEQTTAAQGQDQGTTSLPEASQSESPPQPITSEEMIQTVVSVPEQQFYLAQAGVFSDIASAELAIEPLQKQGFPHFLYEIEGKHHLFVATAPTRDEILGIASFLKNSKMEVYIKELAFPAMEKEVNLPQLLVAPDPTIPDSNKVEAFLTNGFELTRSLSAYSSKVLNQSGKQQPITTEEETKLRDLHRRFLDDSRAVQAGIPKVLQPQFKNMIDGLNQAVTAMTGLKTQNATPYAWQVQKGVFQFVENYVAWSKSSQP